MKIIVILAFSRSGATLLNRVIGMLPDVVICSEVNPLAGVAPGPNVLPAASAVKKQMKEWHDIQVCGESFTEAIKDLLEQCHLSNKQLIIRDWTHVDFRKSKINKWSPSYRFTILDELCKVGNLSVLGFVRDSIDVFLSSGGSIRDFAADYLPYVRSLVELKIPIIKYEELVRNPEDTIKETCDLLELRFSDEYKEFASNDKCTGDIQLGRVSRGMRQPSLGLMPRKRVSRKMWREIEMTTSLLEANSLLGYPETYWNGSVESTTQSVCRRIRNRLELSLQMIVSNIPANR